MSIRDTLLKATMNVRTRVDNALGRGTAMDPVAVRQEILDQIQSRIIVDAGSLFFPFEKVIVHLCPQTKLDCDAIEDTLVKNSRLKADIVKLLNEAQVRYPEELEAVVDSQQFPVSGPAESFSKPVFEMDFVKRVSTNNHRAPETKLNILKGVTERLEYVSEKDRILLGRSREVLDREGRMVRRNDVVFVDGDEEINCSVDRTHARIWYDREKDLFFLLDEGSRYGTRILRAGTVIEVPSGIPDGVCLQSGDDIYCGQALIRFTLV